MKKREDLIALKREYKGLVGSIKFEGSGIELLIALRREDGDDK